MGRSWAPRGRADQWAALVLPLPQFYSPRASPLQAILGRAAEVPSWVTVCHTQPSAYTLLSAWPFVGLGTSTPPPRPELSKEFSSHSRSQIDSGQPCGHVGTGSWGLESRPLKISWRWLLS